MASSPERFPLIMASSPERCPLCRILKPEIGEWTLADGVTQTGCRACFDKAFIEHDRRAAMTPQQRKAEQDAYNARLLENRKALAAERYRNVLPPRY